MTIHFAIGLTISMFILCFTLLVLSGHIRIPPFDLNPSPPMLFTQASQDVMAERARQINVEGYTDEHDDHYTNGMALLRASSCYLDHAIFRSRVHIPGYQADEPPAHWPWDNESWKPKNPRRDLVRAAALILAEIDRIDRLERDTVAANTMQLIQEV